MYFKDLKTIAIDLFFCNNLSKYRIPISIALYKDHIMIENFDKVSGKNDILIKYNTHHQLTDKTVYLYNNTLIIPNLTLLESRDFTSIFRYLENYKNINVIVVLNSYDVTITSNFVNDFNHFKKLHGYIRLVMNDYIVRNNLILDKYGLYKNVRFYNFYNRPYSLYCEFPNNDLKCHIAVLPAGKILIHYYNYKENSVKMNHKFLVYYNDKPEFNKLLIDIANLNKEE